MLMNVPPKKWGRTCDDKCVNFQEPSIDTIFTRLCTS